MAITQRRPPKEPANLPFNSRIQKTLKRVLDLPIVLSQWIAAEKIFIIEFNIFGGSSFHNFDGVTIIPDYAARKFEEVEGRR
ncbi:hypothetical protein DBT_2337 [Dissulfuribacter thermophilus]|uniref:Uncharacterized protein n=1 Tax=Dissulfuribacter thermophilus TaxID=1156395 RepID=A0A1B9F370_9BACT|nr:hypothetical protein DBT_2337 [Dissulfuribacter thermophilus]